MQTFFGFIGPRTNEMAAHAATDLLARSGMLLSPPARAALEKIMDQALTNSLVGLDHSIIGSFNHSFISYSCKRATRRVAGVRLNHPSLNVEGLNLYNLIGKLIERQYRLYAVMRKLAAIHGEVEQELTNQGQPVPIMPALEVNEISNLILVDPRRVLAHVDAESIFASHGIESTHPLVEMIGRVADQALTHALTCDAAKPGTVRIDEIGGFDRMKAFFRKARGGAAADEELDVDVRIHEGQIHVSSGHSVAFVTSEDNFVAQLGEAIAWTHSRWVEVQEELLTLGREADSYLDKLGTNLALEMESSQAVALAG